MKNKKVITLILLLLLCLTGCNQKKEELNTSNSSSDAQKFKEEYESLNNTISKSDNTSYNSIFIPLDNPIKYISIDDALKIMQSETSIFYIGANWCPWCRSAISILFDVAKKNNINTIYYLNLDNDKSVYELKDDKLIKTTSGSDNYYALLDFLKDELSDYILTDSKGKKHSTGEKRIYMPLVISFKKGEVIAKHTGTVTLNKDQTKYDALTKNQEQELYNTYNDILKKTFIKGTCNNNQNCD